MDNSDSPDFWKIPLYKIYTDDEDINIITKIIKRGTNWAIGPEIEEFENSIKNYLGIDYCAVLNSGTSALHAALISNNLHEGDEIIVPSFTFISTVNSVLFVNATPKFSDIEEDTLGLDPEKILQSISKSTKAIIPVDIGGLSCKIDEINQIAEDNNLLVIEDAAEGLGSSIHGKKVGSLSDISIFSFCGNKVLTTGEGGAVVTNDKDVYEKIKLIRSHGRLDSKNYFNDPSSANYISLGYNWRMSSITASLGISQIHKLDKIIKKRQDNAHEISSKLSKSSEIIVPNPPNGFEHIYQLYSIRLRNKLIRDNLHEHLTKKRIFSKVYFKPVHLYPFYQNFHGDDIRKLPKTMEIYDQILRLPLYTNMTSEEKDYLTSSVLDFFEDN